MFRDYTKYEVYDDGRIWSYSHKKFLKPSIAHNGYQLVHLCDNEGNVKTYLLHRVVWEAVTGKPIPSRMQINHRNEIKTDNRFFENLELMTPSENVNYGTRNSKVAKAESKQVGAFNKNGELVMTFSSTRDAGRNGFISGMVSKCCNGKLPHYKGFVWRYI